MKLLRPQFSLRSLLLVTALIAVAVKLWHGPYHVVETINGVEFEYDYYRGFGWERVKHGISIARAQEYPKNNVLIKSTWITVYDHGQFIDHQCDLKGRRNNPNKTVGDDYLELSGGQTVCPQIKLSEDVYQQFLSVIQQERNKLIAEDYEVSEDTISNESILYEHDTTTPSPGESGGFF